MELPLGFHNLWAFASKVTEAQSAVATLPPMAPPPEQDRGGERRLAVLSPGIINICIYIYTYTQIDTHMHSSNFVAPVYHMRETSVCVYV